MKKNRVFILFLLYIAAIDTFSQNVIATAKLDSNKILIGDQIKLKVQLTYPAKTTIFWPELKDTFTKNIEIVQKSKIDTLSKDVKKFTLNQTYTITSFDSGSFYIPQISFKYKNHGDTDYFEALTDSLLLNVNTIAVDTTKAIKDIKGPLSVPWTFMEILPYLIGIVFLAAIIWFLIYYIRKRRRGEALIDFSKPKLPPHEEAMKALEALRNKKLWQNNKVKEYYTELTEIIRTYIEKRFGIHAMEMTTDEIMTSFGAIDIANNTKMRLSQMLVLADLVKFAKAHPLPNEHDICLDNAFEFVKETKPADIPETQAEQQVSEIKNKK
ncbi:MAG: hypothetical protein WC599_00145 [Bacteroidales bacterium]